MIHPQPLDQLAILRASMTNQLLMGILANDHVDALSDDVMERAYEKARELAERNLRDAGVVE